MTLGACFQADDADDEVGATETGTTDTTSESTTESESTTTESESTTTESESTTGVDPFAFASDPPEAYTRVDRMGMPAVATVLITSKDEYNAANSISDPNLQFPLEVNDAIIALHAALNDDLVGLGLDPCSNYPCYLQTLNLILPDTIKLDFATPPGFPNGRRLSDRSIDLTLAVILLDLEVHPVTTFADLPLNPAQNDVVFEPTFPFLAQPH